MIMLQELVSSELEVKVHLLPETSSFSSLAVHLVRHERRAAQPVDQSEVVVGQVSLVGRHFLDGKVLRRLFHQWLEERAVSCVTVADLHGRSARNRTSHRTI